ncbi:MAG: efflux RND transporter periplasmic adaptor subunit, partial [Leptospirillia bacterium]
MNRQTMLAAILALMAGGAIGYWINATMFETAVTASRETGREILFYRNPMNPEITSPTPAKDHMGMDYIPVYADGGRASDGAAGSVSIDPVVVQNIGVRTVEAERRTLSREIHALGRVDYDEERLARLHPKTEGWIEEMMVDATGQPVEKNGILLGIYAPQLVAAQEEYLIAVKNRSALVESSFPDIRQGAEELVTSSLERLRLLDVPEHQIHEMEASGRVKKTLHIHSPFDGVVVRVGARQGQYVTPATELYTIADLSKVWTYVDVYENELSWVRAGDEAVMRISALPGRVFRGRIAYVYPYMESSTRTAKVRLEFDNADQALKPNMFADVTIQASRQVDAVAVPTEAVVRSGEREIVFVVRGPGKFEPREVRLGVTSAGWVQVDEGVQEGERVVTSAQFLIDSESKLREATAKMVGTGSGGDTSGHDMGGHDMGGHDMGGHDMGGHD